MEVKHTSSYFVDIIDTMQNNYNNLQSSILKEKTSYDKKLEIMNALLEYTNHLQNNVSKIIEDEKINKTVFDGDTITTKENIKVNKILFTDTAHIVQTMSNYDTYGNCIHPKVVGNINNILNFSSNSGYIFKDTATVSINEEHVTEYNDILKHDTITNKIPNFDQYSSDIVSIMIDFPANSLIGATNCNAIEISPFLAGGAILKNITIITTPGTQLSNQAIVIDYDQPIEDTRILLDDIYSIKTITFNFKLTFTNNLGLYPFGLRHIYLYNANFDTKNSHIVIKSEYKNLIKYIGDNIIISSQIADKVGNQFSKHETTCSEQNIKLYSYMSGGKLLYPIETYVRDTVNQISRNTKVFYADIPLNKSLYSIEFSKVRT